MSALICGVDFSSKAIHAALIPLDADDGSDAPPVTLRSFEMPTWRGGTTPAFRTVERCRVVRDAMRELLAPINRSGYAIEEVLSCKKFRWIGDYAEVVHVCVETPLGSKSRSTVLWELYGAILASIPSHIERDTITCQEWRSTLIPEAWKRRAISDDWKTWAINYAGCWARREGLDEHEAEATLIAVACRARLDKAFAA